MASGTSAGKEKPGQALDERLFSVGQKKLLQVSMDGLPLQALSNAPRGWAC